MCETKRIDIAQAKFIGSGVKKGELIEGVILNDIYYNIVIKCMVRLRKAFLTLWISVFLTTSDPKDFRYLPMRISNRP